MSLSEIVSVISIIAAIAAVLVATWQVTANLRATERTNTLPVISEIFSEFRSSDFRGSFSRLLAVSSSAVSAESFDTLPEDIREDAYKICYFFDYIGALITFGIVDEKIIISLMGTRVMQTWWAMEAAISNERAYRMKNYPPNAPPGFLVYYEDLVVRIIDMGGRGAARNIQKRLGARHLPISDGIEVETLP